MHLIEVTSADTAKDFLEVQAIINAGNPNYIRPLNNEVNDVFDTAKNKNFKYGEAKRWILESDNGELVGRILKQVALVFLIASMIRLQPIYFLIPLKHGFPKKVWKPWTDLSILVIEISGGA
jgi:hypothetical protein